MRAHQQRCRDTAPALDPGRSRCSGAVPGIRARMRRQAGHVHHDGHAPWHGRSRRPTVPMARKRMALSIDGGRAVQWSDATITGTMLPAGSGHASCRSTCCCTRGCVRAVSPRYGRMLAPHPASLRASAARTRTAAAAATTAAMQPVCILARCCGPSQTDRLIRSGMVGAGRRDTKRPQLCAAGVRPICAANRSASGSSPSRCPHDVCGGAVGPGPWRSAPRPVADAPSAGDDDHDACGHTQHTRTLHRDPCASGTATVCPLRSASLRLPLQ